MIATRAALTSKKLLVRIQLFPPKLGKKPNGEATVYETVKRQCMAHSAVIEFAGVAPRRSNPSVRDRDAFDSRRQLEVICG